MIKFIAYKLRMYYSNELKVFFWVDNIITIVIIITYFENLEFFFNYIILYRLLITLILLLWFHTGSILSDLDFKGGLNISVKDITRNPYVQFEEITKKLKLIKKLYVSSSWSTNLLAAYHFASKGFRLCLYEALQRNEMWLN